MLPKSLHTVRILVAVADALYMRGPVAGLSSADAVLAVAQVIGYPDASADDPLIVKAAAQLAKGGQS